MRRFYIIQSLFWGVGLCLGAQTISIEKPTITPTQEKYKAVEASNMLHAIEGSTAVYKITVAGYDSIASVTSLRYNTIDITSSCHLDKGVLTIDDITITDLKANETQDLRITLIVREKDKNEDTECFADAMSIKVYPTPSRKEVDMPQYLKFYKDTEDDLKWSFKGIGGNVWDCKWIVDNKETTGADFILSRIKEAKSLTLKLTAINMAPDGITEWDKYEEEWGVMVLPEAIIQPSEISGTKKVFLQDQQWNISVNVLGGYLQGWEYRWYVNEKKTDVNSNSYTLSIKDNERSSEQINRNITLVVRNNLPSGFKPATIEKSFSYQATFYPVPEVDIKFSKDYPHNICDGDSVQFGLTILDKHGKSIINDPDYLWNYSWGTENDSVYHFVGANNNNNEGIVHTIKCIISGKLRNLEMPEIKDTLQHTIIIWPKPVVLPLTDVESEYVSCGGRTIPLAVHTFGGQKNGWEFYYGKVGNTPTSSKENIYTLSVLRESQKSTQPVKEEYTMRAINSVEGIVRCDTTLFVSVNVYPEPWMPNDIVIRDMNRMNALASTGIREGNVVALSCEECYGGFPSLWNYSWDVNDRRISNSNETTLAIENVYSGDTKNDSRDITIQCGVNNYHGGEQWASQEYTKQLTIYHKPQTPTSLVIKGNGTSGTVITTTNISDSDLNGHDYYLVFGYIDGNGQMHDATSLKQQNPGEVRWSTQILSAVMNNSSNILYVYALWKYDNGVEITSGLRYISSVDEYWDGSSYSGLTRAVIADATAIEAINNDADLTIPQEYYSTNGLKFTKPSKGFNILKMKDGSVKKIMVK